MKRVLSVILAIIMSVSLLAVTGYAETVNNLDTSADAKKTVFVGEEIELPFGAVTANGGIMAYSYRFSDTSTILVDGEIVESDAVIGGGKTVKFIKTGTVKIYQEMGMRGAKEYEDVYYATIYYVVEPNAIQSADIKIFSDAISKEGPLPRLDVEKNDKYEIDEYYAVCGEKKYTFQETLPVASNSDRVELVLKPKKGYVFGFSGEPDGMLEDSDYEVEYNGVKYSSAKVKRDYAENVLKVSIPIKYSDSVATLFTLSNLDVPYHNGTLDTTATISGDATIKSIKYTADGKTSKASYSKGEKITVTVRVTVKNGRTIDANGKVFWNELGAWSSRTNKIGNSEAEYIFEHTVAESANQIVTKVELEMPEFAVDSSRFTKTISKTEGIVLLQTVCKNAASKLEAGKKYTIVAEFTIDESHFFTTDFKDNGNVTINGAPAKISIKDEKEQIYFAETVLTPSEAGTTDTYTFPFSDVASSQWYYANVKTAHKMGLINGKKADKFAPDDNMTVSEAVKLAACMNVLYNGGDPAKELSNGTDVWYSTYMKYALDNKIIDKDLSSRAGEKITRLEYAYIFSKALPARAFTERNNIPTGSIPDVKSEDSAENKAVYTLYRAGVIAGTDSKGTFNPQSNIKRSEVATILVRMMDSSTRVPAPADLAK